MTSYRNILTQIKVLSKSRRAFASATIQEKRIKVDKWNINYVKDGNGSHHVLCLPGGLGTIWRDYRHVVERFDKEKFSVVAWDPPGHGKSRPPEREFNRDFYEWESDFVYKFMQALEIPRYSLIGMSAGAPVALLHAAKYPDAVLKVVVIAACPRVTPEKMKLYNEMKRDLNTMPEILRKSGFAMYGDDFPFLWNRHVDGQQAIFDVDNGNICAHVLKDIKCPTLLVHGQKDKIAPLADAIKISETIPNARLYVHPDGKHTVHLMFPDDFNKRAQEFLLEP